MALGIAKLGCHGVAESVQNVIGRCLSAAVALVIVACACLGDARAFETAVLFFLDVAGALEMAALV